MFGCSRISIRAGLLALGLALAAALPGAAAEEIFFKFGPLVRSIRVSSLEALVQEGVIEDDLAFYIQVIGLSDAEVDQFRTAIARPVEVDGVLLSRFLYSAMGEDLLGRIGSVMRLRSGSNGERALRAALVNAALSEQGFSTISVIRHLPTNMQVNVADVQAVARAVTQVVEATEASIAQLATLTTTQALQEPPVDYSTLPDLTQPGRLEVDIQRFNWVDDQRDRALSVDVVRPRSWRPGPAPVMVFSHGLSADPASRHRWASHLASHGIVVVLPQHPGSDSIHTANFRDGLRSDLFDSQDFIDRPLDISFVLDQLENLNATAFDGRLDLGQVGVGGHSFGGYTALAVAGATLDFDHLEAACDRRFIHINVSLLLQCQALQLPRQDYKFYDPRVAAIFLVNPVNSSVFSPDSLATLDSPVLVLAGSHDPATPAVFEQLGTFNWFTTDSRSIGLIEGQAHVDLSALDAGLSNLIAGIPGLTLAEPDLVDRYLKALGLAFTERYVARRVDYRVFLRAAYAKHLSQTEPFRLLMINAGDAIEQDLITPLEQLPQLLE
ncbi:MAG: alpha/beta hydrolase [Leptolyngbya sp. LCM1.Bin17]|nr:MAG: alpha/beta hydrolase [Leptolyngbya sp. LCM1.Bin17]